MDTYSLEKKLNELKSLSRPFKDGGKKGLFNFSSNTLDDILKSKRTYLYIAGAIFLILAIIRPDFVKTETTSDQGVVKKSVSFKKFILYYLLITGVLILGLFGYNYQKRKQQA